MQSPKEIAFSILGDEDTSAKVRSLFFPEIKYVLPQEENRKSSSRYPIPREIDVVPLKQGHYIRQVGDRNETIQYHMSQTLLSNDVSLLGIMDKTQHFTLLLCFDQQYDFDDLTLLSVYNEAIQKITKDRHRLGNEYFNILPVYISTILQPNDDQKNVQKINQYFSQKYPYQYRKTWVVDKRTQSQHDMRLMLLGEMCLAISYYDKIARILIELNKLDADVQALCIYQDLTSDLKNMLSDHAMNTDLQTIPRPIQLKKETMNDAVDRFNQFKQTLPLQTLSMGAFLLNVLLWTAIAISALVIVGIAIGYFAAKHNQKEHGSWFRFYSDPNRTQVKVIEKDMQDLNTFQQAFV